MSETRQDGWYWVKLFDTSTPKPMEYRSGKLYTGMIAFSFDPSEVGERIPPPGEQPATEAREALRKAVASVLGKGKGSIVWDNSSYAKGYCNAITAALTAFDDECKRINAAIAKAETPQMAQPQPATVEADWLIYFEDAAIDVELIHTGEESARVRLKALLDNWNCHLFKRCDDPETPAGSNAGEPQKLEKERVMESDKKPLTGLWCENPDTPEGKYLVKRRDGSVVEWPSFVLGAKDPAAPDALRAYADSAERHGMNAAYVAGVRRLADQFWNYMNEVGEGDPDRGRHRADDPATVAEMKRGRSA